MRVPLQALHHAGEAKIAKTQQYLSMHMPSYMPCIMQVRQEARRILMAATRTVVGLPHAVGPATAAACVVGGWDFLSSVVEVSVTMCVTMCVTMV